MSQLDGPLVVVEQPDRYLVARAEDPEDWLCAFERRAGFPARRWAQDMARTWNARLEASAGGGVSCASSHRPPAASGR